VNHPCTVLIAAAELQPLLKQSHDGAGELLVFSNIEIAHALETICARRTPLSPSSMCLQRRPAEPR
jgi:hypothetical protein